jgi:hypothetical protein
VPIRLRVFGALGLSFLVSSALRSPFWTQPVVVLWCVPLLCLIIEIMLCTARAHRFISRLLRSLIRLGMLASVTALVWLIFWSDRRPAQWIDPQTNWQAPLVSVSLFALLVLFLTTLRANPRRVRLRAYPDRLGDMACPRCRRWMRLGHRHAECDTCQRSQLLPRDWWVCECGQPLRGVRGDRCPECGEGPDWSYLAFADADRGPERKPSISEWTLDDVVEREG